MFSDMHVSVTCKCFSMCYHYAIPTPLDYCLQIMMLAVNIQMFTASLQRLQFKCHQINHTSGQIPWARSFSKDCWRLLHRTTTSGCMLYTTTLTFYHTFYITILTFYHTFYILILPYILGICCTLYPYILPYIYYPTLLQCLYYR